MGIFRELVTRLRSVLLILVLAMGQVVGAVGPFMQLEKAVAAPICVVDTAGANDEPGQKDLTKLCVDYAGVPTTVSTTWNWDETGTSGANTMDACNLFDTDGDGNINYSVCVTTQNDPAVLQTLTTYSCGDDKIDRCTSPATVVSSGTTSCSVTQVTNDPFPSGSSNPKDTQGACTVQLSTVGGASAKLVDVCSYPSAQPNSDPSDCVIARNDFGKVELVKDLIPGTDSGLFNLSINGPEANDTTTVNNVGDGGTTGEVVVKKGSVTVSETAGTNTNLSGYTTSIVCRDLNGTGAVLTLSGTVLTGATRQTTFTLAEDADVVCTITNTASSSITINKDAVPNSLQDFAFTATGTGVSNFSLDDDSGVGGNDAVLSNTKAFNNLNAGSYTFTEAQVAAWDLTNLSCSGGASVVKDQANRTVTINLAAGENVTCTFTNTQRGHLIVQKTTLPAGDPTQFSINTTGNGTITGGGAGTISDSTDKDYEVTPGTYSVAETVPGGWAKTGDTCQNVVVAPGATITCLITNTKYATLNVVKDALPNDLQDFGFTTTGLNGAAFSLDDDADGTLPNTQTFGNLLPGNYSVTETATPHWALTGLACDTNNFSANGGTVSVNMAAGQTTTCTFTNTKLVSIFGTKYTSSATGVLGPVLAGWTIFIDANGNGEMDQGELSAVTDQNGDYSFTDLLPGSFTLAEVLQAGWTQIFGPDSFTLAAGETATDKDFGNFQNGSVSGYKWNDVNGNASRQDNEPKLSGWTITLYNAQNQQVDQKVTDVNGNYSFTNLAPGTYTVCETAQTGWVQTFPLSNACHTIVIDQSGEANSANFGNQGRGTITVYKNVDTDGDGDVDVTGATNWTWDIANGAQNTATGSSQNVPAGTYTVSEDQKANFHVVSVVCDTQVSAVSESAQVVVAPGANVTCTFTNARDRGTLLLKKHVINDNGGAATASQFTLHVKQNGTDVAGSPAAGSEAGTSYVLQTGEYTVSEDTPVTGYEQTSIVCDGQQTATITVTTDAEKICVITNDDLAPSLTLVKEVVNDNSGTASADDWTLTADPTSGATISGNGTVTETDANANTAYSLSESGPSGYFVKTDWNCTGTGGTFDANANTITLALDADVTCTIVNDDDTNPAIHVEKTGPEAANPGDTVTYTFTVTNTGDAPLSITTVNDNVAGDGVYQSGDTDNDSLLDLTETWIYAADYDIPSDQDSNIYNTVTVCGVDEREKEVCDSDKHKLKVYAKVIVTKYNDYNRNGQYDPGETELPEPTLPGWDFTLSHDEECESVISLLQSIASYSYGCDEFAYSVTQTTGQDGTTTFQNVLPKKVYDLSETLKDGWHLSNIHCEGSERYEGQVVDENKYSIYPYPGETVECYVGNYQDTVLLIEKSNNKPNPTSVGDTVTYTLKVTVPTNSGPSYNTTVTDLPPEGFTYVPGSWTANSDVRGDLKPEITPEPTYASPGVWQLGNMLPGEVVTLTYQAVIGANVSPGTYPDLAYALGCETPSGYCEVLGNVSAGANTPFVGTKVTIKSPQVLAATILVNTGVADMWRTLTAATLLMGLALATIVRREKKGGAA